MTEAAQDQAAEDAAAQAEVDDELAEMLEQAKAAALENGHLASSVAGRNGLVLVASVGTDGVPVAMMQTSPAHARWLAEQLVRVADGLEAPPSRIIAPS